MDDILDFAFNLAIQTGDLLKKYYNPAGINIIMKPDQTAVTEADLAADKYITQQIKQQFPTDGIISEESSHFLVNPQSPTWVIDPLDGTTNFSLGLAIWGVSIARLIDGYPDLGVIYFPLLNEIFTTRRGIGSYLNTKPISTHSPSRAQAMPFFACCSRSFRNFTINIPYKPRIFGSSIYSISLVARGAALIGFDATSKIWDLAAAWLLVEEAGGFVSLLEGSSVFPILPDVDYSTTSYATLSAATLKLLNMGRSKIVRK